MRYPWVSFWNDPPWFGPLGGIEYTLRSRPLLRSQVLRQRLLTQGHPRAELGSGGASTLAAGGGMLTELQFIFMQVTLLVFLPAPAPAGLVPAGPFAETIFFTAMEKAEKILKQSHYDTL